MNKMYDIEIDYTTGSSFGSEREKEMLCNPSSLKNAKENLKRIKEHSIKYAEKHSRTGEEYKLELLTDHGVRKIFPFWMGYFETLHGAKIITDDDEMSFKL